ncbi:hypothetical protein ABPG75_011166 [Micractinium tetrahymenae]
MPAAVLREALVAAAPRALPRSQGRPLERRAVAVQAFWGRRGSSGSGDGGSGGRGSGDGGGEPPSPSYESEVDRLNLERVQTLTDSQLRGRLKRMKQPAKLESFIKVLKDCGKSDLAAEAERRLYAVTVAMRAEAPSDLEAPEEPAPPAAEPRLRRPRRRSADASEESDAQPSEKRRPAARRAVRVAVDAEQQAKRWRQRMQNVVADRLIDMGMEVYVPDGDSKAFDWGMLAGYDEVKRQVEESIVLALSHPEVYDEIAAATRGPDAVPGANRPRAVLFEGPPGTGKTTCARVIAEQGAVPLVNVRLEHILSKWYGEDEKKLAEVLHQCESFPEGAVVFLDELDSVMSSRDDHLHETTKRMLGILLRHLEGLDGDDQRRTVFIGATNRKADLDPALRSRFAATIRFDLPDAESRAAILRRYARHLADSEVAYLAKETPGMAGRDLRAVCALTERRWAAQVIKGRVAKGQLPTVLTYVKSAEQRQRDMEGGPDKGPPGAGRGAWLR